MPCLSVRSFKCHAKAQRRVKEEDMFICVCWKNSARSMLDEGGDLGDIAKIESTEFSEQLHTGQVSSF